MVSHFSPILPLCHPLDWSPPGFSAHGILQAGILECVAVFSSRESSRPRDRTLVSPVWQTGSLPLSHWGRPDQPDFKHEVRDIGRIT